MKLAAKFTLAFLMGMGVILGVHAYLIFQREVDLFQTDMRRDDHMVGQALAVALERLGRDDGEAAVLDCIARTDQNENPVKIRWTWLDAPPDSPHAPHVPPAQRAALARGEEVVFTAQQGQADGQLYTYVPVRMNNSRLGALELAESLRDQRSYTRSTLLRIAGTMGVIIVTAGLLALMLGLWFVGRPVHALIGRTRRVAVGDFSGRLDFRQHDEMRELAEELNAMCDQLAEAQRRVAAETAARLAALEQLRHADRLRTVGQLTSGIAHELGTPLNVVWARAKMIVGGEVAEKTEVADSARVIVEQSARMTGIIRQLLDFARPRNPSKAQVDLCLVVRKTFALLMPIADKRHIALELDGGEAPLPVEVDADQMQQVLSNLVLNAVQAMPQGGQVLVRVRRARARPPADHGGPEGEYLCLSVCDQGEGIPEENLARIFEPFFTTKDVGQGTGLGLSVSRGIIHEHGGWIGVESRIGQGSCFSVYLPQGTV